MEQYQLLPPTHIQVLYSLETETLNSINVYSRSWIKTTEQIFHLVLLDSSAEEQWTDDNIIFFVIW